MTFASRLLAWLAASGPAAPLAIFALVFAESGLMLFVPGETAVIAGGVLAAAGALPWTQVALAAVAGAAVGDGAGFLLGRGPGRRRFLATGRFLLLRTRHVRRVEAFLARWGIPSVLLARFVPVGRVAGPFVFGLTGVSPARFFPLDAASSLVWGVFFAGAGYLLGDAWEEIHRTVGRVVLILALAAGALAWVLWLRARRAASREPSEKG
ncbi:MAG TPA: VTT domain-containing protein [Myxococcales bacterium]|nr:VTT domain-containing protein [Myxococcales bacterium]